MKNMKLWDWVVWNQRFKWKIIEYFMASKKLAKNRVRTIKLNKTDNKSVLWIKMIDKRS